MLIKNLMKNKIITKFDIVAYIVLTTLATIFLSSKYDVKVLSLILFWIVFIIPLVIARVLIYKFTTEEF